jgi:NAD(P)-dependent dehydrogenase (short-subunit alcohol dehydrogenase family)
MTETQATGALLHRGRVAVITGGANGIGRSIAVRMAADGADVAIVDIADAEPALAEIRALGGRALGVSCDVTSEEAVRDAAEAVTSGLGTASILVNNVGIYPYDPFAEIDFAKWRHVMAINVDSVFLVSTAFVPGMRAQGWGRVINMASNTFHAGTYPDYVHYITSKGAVVGFTRALASAVGPDGVTVNALAPGLTLTDTVIASRPAELFDEVVESQAIKRPQQPADMAGIASFLASEEAGFITGQTLPVDGGLARV